MRVPDGCIDAPVSVAAGVFAAGAVAVSLRGARREPTVREDVAFGPASAGLRGPELEERVLRALKQVGLEE